MSQATLTEALIRTPRLTLRPLVAADAPRLAELAGDYDVARMTTSMPHPYRLADAEAFVRRARAADPEREAVFALELAEQGPIGVLGFDPSEGQRAPEVGYWIGRPWWGRGLATEMLVAAMAWAGEAWGKRWVRARHFVDNPASGAVLVKAGFLYTGEIEMKLSVARGEPVASRWMVWLA